VRVFVNIWKLAGDWIRGNRFSPRLWFGGVVFGGERGRGGGEGGRRERGGGGGEKNVRERRGKKMYK